MKKILMILALICCLTAVKANAATTKANAKLVLVLSVNRDLFYFSLEKEYFQDAKVEIYDAQGVLQCVEILNNRKTIIDFFDMPSGKYTIKVKKGVLVEDFDFEKK